MHVFVPRTTINERGELGLYVGRRFFPKDLVPVARPVYLILITNSRRRECRYWNCLNRDNERRAAGAWVQF